MWKACKLWLDIGTFSDTLIDTNIILIPKYDHPLSMKDYRPISLCNVLYKIIAKILANRLKVLLPNLIDESRSAFVLGRLI